MEHMAITDTRTIVFKTCYGAAEDKRPRLPSLRACREPLLLNSGATSRTALNSSE